MDNFEDWLTGVPALALRELACVGNAMRSTPVELIRRMVLTQPDLRARAEESWRIEREGRAAVEAMDPWVLRDRKIRYGLVD